jgi:hypothetical protein
MRRPPHDVKDGVFSWPVVIDCFAYIIVMGALSLAAVRRPSYQSLVLILHHADIFRFLVHCCGLWPIRWSARARLQPFNKRTLQCCLPWTVHYFCDDHFLHLVVRFRVEALYVFVNAPILFEVSLTSFSLVDRSLFSLTAGRPFWIDLIENKILFLAVVGGMISVVLREYRPFIELPLSFELMERSVIPSHLRSWL